MTTEPNAFFGHYHDRQVCTLTPDEADLWMAGGDPEDMMALLHAPAVDEWEAVPIDSRIFGSGRRELEDLVPIGEPERWAEGFEGPAATPGTDAAASGRPENAWF